MKLLLDTHAENIPIVTADPIFRTYKVKLPAASRGASVAKAKRNFAEANPPSLDRAPARFASPFIPVANHVVFWRC